MIHHLQVVGSLSDGIGKVHLDAKHNTKREQIRSTSHDSGGQFVSGMKGLGHGMLGGFKSVLKPFEGARKGGAEVCRSNYCKFIKFCEGLLLRTFAARTFAAAKVRGNKTIAKWRNLCLLVITQILHPEFFWQNYYLSAFKRLCKLIRTAPNEAFLMSYHNLIVISKEI